MTHASIAREERLQLGISDSLVRLSVGIEDVEDLIDDIDQALKAAVSILDMIYLFSWNYYYQVLLHKTRILNM